MADMKAGVRPRRGAPPKGEVSARERALATAGAAWARNDPGVQKRSLYRVFDSKDALISAFAAEKDRLFWAWWDDVEKKHAEDPRALLDALISGIAHRVC